MPFDAVTIHSYFPWDDDSLRGFAAADVHTAVLAMGDAVVRHFSNTTEAYFGAGVSAWVTELNWGSSVAGLQPEEVDWGIHAAALAARVISAVNNPTVSVLTPWPGLQQQGGWGQERAFAWVPTEAGRPDLVEFTSAGQVQAHLGWLFFAMGHTRQHGVAIAAPSLAPVGVLGQPPAPCLQAAGLSGAPGVLASFIVVNACSHAVRAAWPLPDGGAPTAVNLTTYATADRGGRAAYASVAGQEPPWDAPLTPNTTTVPAAAAAAAAGATSVATTIPPLCFGVLHVL